MTRNDVEWREMTCHDMKWHATTWNDMKCYEILWNGNEMHFPKKKLTFSSDGKWIDDTKASTMTTKLFAYVVKKDFYTNLMMRLSKYETKTCLSST